MAAAATMPASAGDGGSGVHSDGARSEEELLIERMERQLAELQQ